MANTSFGTPVESTGLSQDKIDGADLVILPGGLVMVDQAGPLADLPGLGRPISGLIYCEEKS